MSVGTQGTHLIVELSGCEPDLLDDKEYVEEALKTAATMCSATVIGSLFHKFEPSGVTGVLAIAESHFSIHTWPEKGYAALDFYTCGNIDAYDACKRVARFFNASNTSVLPVARGTESYGVYRPKAGFLQTIPR